MRTTLKTAAIALAVATTSSVGAQPQAPLDQQRAKAMVVERFGDQAMLRWDKFAKQPRALRRLTVPTHGPDETARARGFVLANGDLLGLEPVTGATLGDQLRVAEVRHHHQGRSVVRFSQIVDGLEVEGRTMTVSMDAQGRVRGVRSDFVPVTLAPLTSDIGPAGAAAAIRERYRVVGTGTPTKVVLATGPALARIAYRVPVAQIPLSAHFNVWVDAENGAILRQAPAGHDQAHRRLLEVGR